MAMARRTSNTVRVMVVGCGGDRMLLAYGFVGFEEIT
jgi:hypothetical protein